MGVLAAIEIKLDVRKVHGEWALGPEALRYNWIATVNEPSRSMSDTAPLTERQHALCYANLAEACLYFDHIVPLAVFFDDTFRAMRSATKPEDLRSTPH